MSKGPLCGFIVCDFGGLALFFFGNTLISFPWAHYGTVSPLWERIALPSHKRWLGANHQRAVQTLAHPTHPPFTTPDRVEMRTLTAAWNTFF